MKGGIYEVVFNNGAFELKSIHNSKLDNVPLNIMLSVFDAKIIGNRYDNPELLRL